MTFQFSTAARNASLDAIETAIGTGTTLELRTGAPPADCAAADAGTLLASMTLPADWMAAASGGSKALLGTWSDNAADAAGTVGQLQAQAGRHLPHPGHGHRRWRGGDMVLDNPVLAVGQEVSVTAFTLTAGGA